jgi:hypothetical protein
MMTTLAYKDGVLAADTKITGGSMTFYGPKMVRTPCGGMVAAAGLSASATAFLEWMGKGQKGKRPGVKEIDAIWVKGDGTVWSINEHWPPVRIRGFCAAGSGAMAAMAGMEMGLSAQAAVELACKIDPETGGPVDTMEVEKP